MHLQCIPIKILRLHCDDLYQRMRYLEFPCMSVCMRLCSVPRIHLNQDQQGAISNLSSFIKYCKCRSFFAVLNFFHDNL